MIVVLAGTVFSSRAQEYKFEIGGMAGGAFYMGDDGWPLVGGAGLGRREFLGTRGRYGRELR